MAAVSLTNMIYLEEIKHQMQSFVQAFATAIDKRTPYNASHTRMVTKYAVTVAQKLDELYQSGQGGEAFDDTRIEQLRLAAGLHDIGKMVVPLSVMNKSTRLDGAIKEIEQRFAYLRVTFERDLLKGWLSHADYEDKIAELDADLAIIQEANEAGFLVTLNHPYWSMQNYTDYCDLEGLWGVEVYNHFSYVFGLDSNDQAFCDLLNQGKQVFPICGDDCHNEATSLGCFTMIKSENLEYNNVMSALKRGDFYSSNGPEIKELILDGTTLSFKCSDARRVILNTECRASSVVADNGKGLTEGSFNLKPYFEVIEKTKDNLLRRPYFRIMVEDREGKRAYSRAYFLDSDFRILA
jgi:hypothetical protein